METIEEISRAAAEDCVSRVPNTDEYSDIILSAIKKVVRRQDAIAVERIRDLEQQREELRSRH